MDFISILSIFVLACFVGYYVVWSVTPALHTPLMCGDQRDFLGDHRRRADRGRGGGQRRRRNGSGWSRWRWPASTSSAASRSPRGCSPCTRRRSASDAWRPRARTPAWVLLAYLVAGICFILALRGLSSPASSRRGNRFGMFGMAIAVATTLVRTAARRTAMAASSIDWDARRDPRRDRDRRRRSASSPRARSR